MRGGSQMISYQQRLAAFTKLVAELNELELLREQVKKAELLLRSSRQTAVERRSSRTKPPDNDHRLRLPRSW